jgi:tRNA/tmRNA/rRNA uracil-C5-methylase (TrmA/RlmC/RlmD family)
VVKTSDNGTLQWGGMGRHSLRLSPENYIWTKVRGKKIYHSMDTFFQANASILPRVLKVIESIIKPNKKTVFLDLYSGVGLFGLLLAKKVKHVHMVEEISSSITLARYNIAQLKLKNVTIHEGKVEDVLLSLRAKRSNLKPGIAASPFWAPRNDHVVALVDPPRKGLSEAALKVLVGAQLIAPLLYLSCGPESLLRDLLAFKKKGWKIKQVIPFDFFPRTKHLETLVVLQFNR